MDIDKKKLKLKEDLADLPSLVEDIKRGRSILFTGAGFSFGATSVGGGEPLTAPKLSEKISELADIPLNKNLMFSSDYYLKNNPASDLIKVLLENYTLKSVSDSQVSICSLNWRRFYTTNYDKSIEIASGESDKVVETVDINFPTKDYYKRDGVCVHLNGSIDILTEASLDKEFKLTQSSYVSPESFLSSDWFYYFKRDLERASSIVFVGYSLYDIDIQRVLFQDPGLKEKTYFITRPDPDIELNFTLSKFGKVVPIGVNGFAQLISESRAVDDVSPTYSLQSLSQYDISEKSVEVRDENVERMLMYGDVSDGVIDSSILNEQKVPILVVRDCLAKVNEVVSDGRNVIVFGGLGNGKTLLLKELRCYLVMNGFDVYELDDSDADYIGDVDFLSKSKSKSVILLDDYEQYLDLMEHFARSKPDNISIVAAARVADHEYCRDVLAKFGFEYSEFSVDLLTDSELYGFVDIIDNLGVWGEKAGYSSDRKAGYLKKDNEGHISDILISIFSSPQIKSKISLILNKLKHNPEYESTVLAICLCRILGVECNRSIVSELANNDAIFSSGFNQNSNFKQLFRSVDGRIASGSSVFCMYLIKEHFSASYITSQLLSIANRFNKIDRRDYVQERIFKSMLKFSFIERILPKTTKVGNLQKYYEDLKVAIPWLRGNPHFWLQYAMSFMVFRDYTKAQVFLEQAYSLANSKDKYDTKSIDTQQARLWLISSEILSDGNVVFSNFEKAHRILMIQKVDTYNLRQVFRYKDFYSNNFQKLSVKNREAFISSCRDMYKRIFGVGDDFSINKAQLERTKDCLLEITGDQQ